jgi:hypothetical protein
MNDQLGFSERTYRRIAQNPILATYRVIQEQTDLWVSTDRDLSALARETVLECRSQLEGYINLYPEFLRTLCPWPGGGPAPEIVRNMIQAAAHAGVGPMAAVAGAIAEMVGVRLMHHSRTVIIENGGDIFLCADAPIVAAVFAGKSPLSMKIGLRIDAATPCGLCTSSGTVGHSLSFGRADAVSVLSRSCSLADAAATAIANRVQTDADIESAIAYGQSIPKVEGILIIVGKHIGAWGKLEIVPLAGKRY